MTLLFVDTPSVLPPQHASEALSADKAVTREDARKVEKAEARGDPEHHIERRGVAAQMQAAAQLNESE